MGAAAHNDLPQFATVRFTASTLPYLPGSAIPLQIQGIDGPYRVDVLGDASVEHGELRIAEHPSTESATAIASTTGTLAMHRFTVAAPLRADESFIAVASYDSGVVIHDVKAPFAQRSVLGVGGAPADVALDDDARLAAADTAGDTLTLAGLVPWRVTVVSNVPFTDELAFDPVSHDLFATDRDINGSGALTRITPEGTVTRTLLGATSEGIAIDAMRSRVYVANTNDGSVSIVDARTMREIRRFHAVDRVFSLALSPDGDRLYAVSNQSLTSPFAAMGGAIAIDVASPRPRVVARSKALSFPVGVALDARRGRLYVTDEHDDVVYVLDSRTLRAVHAPIRTCRTPWKPAFDAQSERLYVPCAQADKVDVFDTRTLRRAPGAPFTTGGYPLAVAVWHSKPGVVR